MNDFFEKITFTIYCDWKENQFSLHILPALSIYVTSYMREIAFSWLFWTVELRREIDDE